MVVPIKVASVGLIEMYKSFLFWIYYHFSSVRTVGVVIISLYICIIFKWRNWCYLRINMTSKSSKHLHATNGALNSCFDLIRSHQQCTPWSPPLEIELTTTVWRSRNSTTGPPFHATYKSWWIVRPLWPNVSWRYVIPTEDTATSGATSSQVGVTSPHNINLMGRIYNYIIFK